MKKIVALLLVLTMLTAGMTTTTADAAGSGRGGFMGFIAGCCFGIRAGAAYNDGKDIHWREWIMLIPYVNIIFAIWNGIDGASGLSTDDYAARYGSAFY